jgi:8-amino-7-oxononanoate synthase
MAAEAGTSCWDLPAALRQRREQHLFRRRLTLDSAQAARVSCGGREYLSFCSNDYLGLANHPVVVAAMVEGVHRFGVGAGASHLVTGHMAPHQALEEELAAFVGAERALVFSTGYMANLGVASALTGRGDLIVEDRLNHASLIDGGLLSRAVLRRYPHGDLAAAERALVGHSGGRRLVSTDGVFSMDGDLAPLVELLALARRHDARIVLDDAHGLGVLGAAGGGTLEHLGVRAQSPLVLVGTLGKAFGTFGAFAAGDADVIETLVQQARTYIYTTAPPPALAEATRAALRVAREEGWRRELLGRLVARFRAGARALEMNLMPSSTPIQPVVVGGAERALALARALHERGILVVAIRPPTVPAGTARLRITLSAAHTERDVDHLLGALGSALAREGVARR